ncbi:MAG: sulfotransferase [Pseudomonadota bacterium]
MRLEKLNDPLFIIGNPRSGTSMLRLILTSHTEVLIPPECGFIIWLQNKYADWHRADNNDPAKLSQFVEDLFSSKKFETWLLDKQAVENQITSRQPESYAELCGAVYGAFGQRIGKQFTVWGDKNNFHINHLTDLLALYSKARFLHIVRDGRDVACSYREVMALKSISPYAPKLNTAASDIALEWSNNVMKVDSFISLMPGDQVMTIRYEDLVLKSSETCQLICKWLGLSFEEEMLNFYQQNKDNQLEPDLTIDWKKRTLQPISGDTIGRYRNILNKEERIQFESVAAQALKKFCYA